MTNPYYWHLANKKLNGNITGEEDAKLKEWINQSSENLKNFETYKKLWLRDLIVRDRIFHI